MSQPDPWYPSSQAVKHTDLKDNVSMCMYIDNDFKEKYLSEIERETKREREQKYRVLSLQILFQNKCNIYLLYMSLGTSKYNLRDDQVG